MSKGMGSIVCAIFALLTMVGGFFLTGVPLVGAVMSFLSPAIALVGIVFGGLGMSEAKKTGEAEGTATTGLVINIIAFILGLVIALTCGLCNACMTASGAAAGGAVAGAAGQLQQVAEEAQRQAEIRRQQEQEVLGNLNEMCPDTWCEGPWTYRFTGFRCPPGNVGDCALSATAQSNDVAGLNTPVELIVLRSTTQRDSQGQLTDAFDMEINRVIGQWEQTQGAALLSPPSGSPQGVPQGLPQGVPQGLPQGVPQGLPQADPNGLPEKLPPPP